MANCPNCGSNHIQLKRETNVSWGRAITGLALFGVVGGAVGAVTGEDRNANACLDCGTSWKAEELYKILQIINDYTGHELDLSIAKDRVYMNKFISEIIPYLKAIPETAKKAEKFLVDTKKEAESKKGSLYAGVGLLLSLGGCTAVIIGHMTTEFIVILIPFFIGMWIDDIIYKNNKKVIDKEIEQIIENSKRKAIRMKIEAEEELKLKLEMFINNNK
ncbi:hypothetical protein [Nostoc sp. 'Peltigera membranacea cyanobiont' N6]|uniref:hypothetical protein n=1 Tax=Nostoc sp. 'Peltigera membranacea cyanobiont' N6 TaxID=1261031 RepID=UPI000CF31DA4|nr:hypothetical protein [Nostoc sp. 'Peltigera membranacea cyanobiont' N6]AVH68294.1 hypothetical protein NPM_100020 [Nostoc sp. 'Peltigera membranacea cyanobiont' N6]